MTNRRILMAAAGLSIAVLAIITGAWIWLVQSADQPGPLAEDRIVRIVPGAGLKNIARQLHREGTIDNRLVFEVVARFRGTGRNLQAGEYRLPARASMNEILEILKSGDVVQRRVTVPEGWTSAQIVDLLMKTEGLVGTIESVPREGSLLPETYYFTYGEERKNLIHRMKLARDEVLARLWANRQSGLPLDTPEEAVILASIVEKETAIAEERPLVAAVFINRLKKRMRLQSDPTVIYGITGGQPLGRPIRQSELEAANPYNTYQRYGLPPGPIANPGTKSLSAVLQPSDVDYLYFVADGDGGHVFADTLAEHNENVAKWRLIRRQRRQNDAPSEGSAAKANP